MNANTEQERIDSNTEKERMDSNIEDDALQTFAEKDSLEQSLAVGIHGVPDFKRSEKNNYLGEFRERVLKRLTKKQAAKAVIYPEIKAALKDPRMSKMLISGELSSKTATKYIKLALQLGKPYTVIHDPEMKGETGLVVISGDAVDVEDIDVKEDEA